LTASPPAKLLHPRRMGKALACPSFALLVPAYQGTAVFRPGGKTADQGPGTIHYHCLKKGRERKPALSFLEHHADIHLIIELGNHLLQPDTLLRVDQYGAVDVGTDLVLKAAADFTIYDEAHHVERSYSDYKTVDGFVYPHKFTYPGRDGTSRLTATVEKLEINLPLEGRFSIP